MCIPETPEALTKLLRLNDFKPYDAVKLLLFSQYHTVMANKNISIL